MLLKIKPGVIEYFNNSYTFSIVFLYSHLGQQAVKAQVSLVF